VHVNGVALYDPHTFPVANPYWVTKSYAVPTNWLELGPDDPREANPSYPAVFGAVLLRSRRMLSVGLAKQNAEAVTRGYKGATLYTEPAAQTLEVLELVDATELVQAGRGAGAGGGEGADGGDRAV
jgi:hypothetical protein